MMSKNYKITTAFFLYKMIFINGFKVYFSNLTNLLTVHFYNFLFSHFELGILSFTGEPPVSIQYYPLITLVPLKL